MIRSHAAAAASLATGRGHDLDQYRDLCLKDPI